MSDSDSDDPMLEVPKNSEISTSSEVQKDAALVSDGNEVVEFKLIRKPEDVNDDSLIFKPGMCHQFFGDKENIYGYKDLRIKLYYSACSLEPYMQIDYSFKKVATKMDSLEADNIEDAISKNLQIPFERNLDEFIKKLSGESKFNPGDFEHLFKVDSPDGKKTFVIYHGDIAKMGFVSYLMKMQSFLKWFVDAASFIDIDDDKWKLFLVYEWYKVNEENYYAFVGYASLYEYYGYPCNIRPRISQVLILPPFQNQGLCTELLKFIYNFYKDDPKVKDFTVEDPSPEFQSVRDFVDCQMFLNLPTFENSETITLKMVLNAAGPLRINEKQARRVYEILRLLKCNRNNEEEFNRYKKEIEDRIGKAHRLHMKRVEKYKRWYPAEVFEKILGKLRAEEEQCNSAVSILFPELLSEYERVVNRLKANHA